MDKPVGYLEVEKGVKSFGRLQALLCTLFIFLYVGYCTVMDKEIVVELVLIILSISYGLSGYKSLLESKNKSNGNTEGTN